NSGPLAGRAFATYGMIFQRYLQMGGSGSWLGFPTSDEYAITNGRRSDFEGGYILYYWGQPAAQEYRNPPPNNPGPPSAHTPPNTIPTQAFNSLNGAWYREGDPNRPARIAHSGAELTF